MVPLTPAGRPSRRALEDEVPLDPGLAHPWCYPGAAVVVDTLPPSITVIGPARHDRWAGALVTVRADEALGSWAATITDAAGHAVPLGVVADEGGRYFGLLVPSSGLASGMSSLDVGAWDLAGNSSARSVALVLGDDPYVARPDTTTLFGALAWTSRRYEAHASDTPLPPPWSSPMPTRERQAYRRGEVVYLRVRVTDPGTDAPVDPDVVHLVSLTLRQDPVVITIGGVDLTREREGLYYLPVDTTDLPAGTYDWLVRMTGVGSTGATVVPGYFVVEGAV